MAGQGKSTITMGKMVAEATYKSDGIKVNKIYTGQKFKTTNRNNVLIDSPGFGD
jgi:hypothetical protein